jgi:hypothetical protein
VSLTPPESLPAYYYYSLKKFDCSNSCSEVFPGAVGRSSSSSLGGDYYKLGSFTYQPQTLLDPQPSYDINLDILPSNSNCAIACIS